MNDKSILIMEITMNPSKVRGEARSEDKSSTTLTGLNLIYPGLLVFYVEVGRNKSKNNFESSSPCQWANDSVLLSLRVARKTSTTFVASSTTWLLRRVSDWPRWRGQPNKWTSKPSNKKAKKQPDWIFYCPIYLGIVADLLCSSLLHLSWSSKFVQVKVVHLIHNMRATLLPSWHYRAVDPPLRYDGFTFNNHVSALAFAFVFVFPSGPTASPPWRTRSNWSRCCSALSSTSPSREPAWITAIQKLEYFPIPDNHPWLWRRHLRIFKKRWFGSSQTRWGNDDITCKHLIFPK